MRLDLYTCGCPYARRVAVYLLGACIPAGCDDGIPTRITFPHIHLTHIQKDHSIRYKKYRLCLKWSLRHNKYPSTYIYIIYIYSELASFAGFRKELDINVCVYI